MYHHVILNDMRSMSTVSAVAKAPLVTFSF